MIGKVLLFFINIDEDYVFGYFFIGRFIGVVIFL